MVGFIYIIKNTVNSKVYIGQTRVSVETRWKEHLRHARYGDQLINRAMNKYGVENFYIETLEICDHSVIDEREMYYIDLYDSTNKSKGYNMYVNDRFTLQEIANKFGVTRYIITTELRNAGITIRDNRNGEALVKNFRNTKQEVLKALEQTGSLRKAAKLLNISYSAFRHRCIEYHIEYNSSKSARH